MAWWCCRMTWYPRTTCITPLATTPASLLTLCTPPPPPFSPEAPPTRHGRGVRVGSQGWTRGTMGHWGNCQPCPSPVSCSRHRRRRPLLSRWCLLCSWWNTWTILWWVWMRDCSQDIYLHNLILLNVTALFLQLVFYCTESAFNKNKFNCFFNCVHKFIFFCEILIPYFWDFLDMLNFTLWKYCYYYFSCVLFLTLFVTEPDSQTDDDGGIVASRTGGSQGGNQQVVSRRSWAETHRAQT